MPAAKWGRPQSPLSRAVKSYPLSDSYLKEAYPPLLQLQNLNINTLHTFFRRQTACRDLTRSHDDDDSSSHRLIVVHRSVRASSSDSVQLLLQDA
jgi:hypothetical protein